MRVILLNILLSANTPGGPLDSGNTPHNDGLGEMMLRIGLFMLGLLIFVFVCAYAWKTIPALRRILPPPKPEAEPKPAEPRLMIYTSKTSESSPAAKAPEVTKISALLSDDPIGDAIADGRPGSVVRAASDLEGVETPAPIIFVRRED